MSVGTETPAEGHAIDLAIGGMTCASCAARVEKRLNRMDGVTAQVNFATEKARVQVPAGVSADDLIAEVEATGYGRGPFDRHLADRRSRRRLADDDRRPHFASLRQPGRVGNRPSPWWPWR